MKALTYKRAKELQTAVDRLVADVYGFSVILKSGSEWYAQSELLDVVFLVLENQWFVFDDDETIPWEDFRIEVFQMIWKRFSSTTVPGVSVDDSLPVGTRERSFYKLALADRAAIYLRTKKKFSYDELSAILGLPKKQIIERVEKSREILLARELRAVEFSQEEF